MAENLLPPINIDLGGLTVPKPGQQPNDAYDRLKGDGTIPPGTPAEVVRMLDDTGGDPAVEPPQIFSDKDPTQPRQVPDPQDPLASNPYGIDTRPAESYAPDWAKADLIAPINPELRKRNEARYDPNFLDRVFKTIGLPAGFGRQVTADDQKQIEADRKKAVEDARKTITEQILYPGSAALDGPVDQPVNPFVLGQNVEQNAVVKKAEQTVAQGKPEMEAWRNFTENSIQGVLTTLVSLPRGIAQGVDVPRAIGAWLRGNENLDQNVVAERLQKVTQDIQSAIPGDPGRKTELLTTLGQGTGSMAGFLVGGAALRGIGMSFNRATMLAGATTGGTQMYDDAEAHGAGVAGRYFSFLVGSALGATEALPIDRAFYWLNKEGGGIVHRMLRSAAIDGLTEMGQEVGQQLGQNLTAKFIYDHEREIFDGVKDAGLAAGIIGSMFGLGLHSVHALTAKHARREQLEAAQKALADLQGQTPPPAAGSPPASNVAPAAGTPAATPSTSAQLAPSAQTQTEEFRRWFGGSKVVDEQGKPLVVYHGTLSDFTEFKKIDGENGFFFTADTNYSYVGAPREGGQVMPVYLKIEKPYFIERSEKMEGLNRWEDAPAFIDKLKAEGYDGIIWGDKSNLRSPPRGAWGNDRSQIFVFDPTQIKSATGNSGAFDPNDPNISAIVTPQQALETNVPLELPVDPIFSQAVQNTEGAQITPDGLLIDVVRFQKTNMEGAQAVRTGVFYLPSSSSQVRYYRNSKTGYGGEARFGGETLIRKPLFVKGATGGAAPEAAYAQLKGKEALQQMIGDVMRVVTRGGNYIRPDLNLKVSLINEFLDKYAPELSGSGSFIESVSREGNTLRYALQELAVAHAARAAGYDAVVGYSGSKTGPKISEVFDLREQTFPARGMESQVHEDFSPQLAPNSLQDTPRAEAVAAVKQQAEIFADQTGVDMVLRQVPDGAQGDLELTDMFARETGKGNGTKAMQKLVELADAYGLNIYTHPSEPRNVEFYSRFGFEREPKPRYSGLTLVRYPPLDLNDESQLKSLPPAEGAPPAFADAPAAAADPTQEPVVPPEQMQPLLPPGVTDLFAIAGKNGALVTGVPDAQPAPQDGDVSGIVRAYHGSPHTFDRFSMDKIGTGEGAQAYGHGLYFAESEGVARSYRDTLSAPRGESPEDIAGRVYEAFKQDRQGAIAELQRRVDSLERRRVEDPASVPSDMRAGETALHKALAYLKSGATPGGALYEVVINANPDDFLDWDKPLSQQPQALKDYLAKADLSHLPEGGRLRRTIEAYRKNPGDWVPPPGASIPEPMGHQVYDALTEYGGGAARNAALTKAMLDAGIPGVKYLDAGSRSQGDGSRNYVVFDENLVRIVKRNGQDAGGDVSAILAPEKPRPLYPLERARSMAGIPEKAPTAEPTASKKDIAERFKEALDLVVKQGRFGRGSSKAEAIYKWGQSVARVKNEGQLLELFHEGGHHLHSILDTLLEPLISKHQSEIYMIADKLYGGGGQIKAGDTLAMRREGFATFFQVYMNNPAEARVIAPGFLPEFEALMEENKPGIQKELQAIREEVDAWLTSKSSAQLARERVISNKPLGVISKIAESIKGGTVLHDVATLANRVYQATLNDQHPLTLAARKLLKIAEENIRVQIERGLINRQQALQQLEALTRRGRANPVKMATLARNSYHASSEMIASGWAKYGGDGSPASKGLAEILKDVMKGKRLDQKLYDDFNTYLAMRRVVTEWKNYYAALKWDHAKNYGPASANAGAQEPPVKRFRRPDDVSMGDAQQAIKDIEAANPHFAVAAGHVYQFLDEMLQYKVDAGILTQEAADMQRQIADYVPLRREMDDTKSGTVGQGKDARTGKDNLIRVFRGSSRRIISPIESIMQQAHETVALVAKNDVKRSLAQLALDVGKGSGAVMEKIPASTMKGTSVKLADVIKAAGDFSLAEEVAQAMGRDEITMQEFLDEVLDGDEVGTIWRKADISEKGDPIVYVWNNGELEAYQLNDPEWADDLFNALTELGKEQTNLAIQILGVPSAVLRAGVTTAPPFLIANLVRDQLGAWVLNDGVYPGVTMGKGIASDLFDRKARRLYNLSMASIGGSNIAALDKTRFGTEQTMLAKIGIGVTAEDSMTTALRAIESTETFTRQGIWQSAFKKAKADGLNDADAMLEAGFEASDFANYGRAGSKMLLARRLVTFLNANLQNMDKSLRVSLGGEAGAAWLRKELAPWVRRQLPAAALSRMGLDGSQTSLPMTAAEKKQLARAGRTLTKMMMMLAIPSALLAALYWDDEEYQDMSPYLKGTRWMVKVAPGKWLAIPKPFQLATFATFTEYAIESVLREDPTAMTKFMQSQAGVIAPPFENPFIKMFYELYTNKDTFSGRDIVTPSVAARPGWLQYDEYTSELAKSIGYFTGASPMVVDHVITGSFATWGRGMQSASNLLNPNRPAQGFDDFAFTSYFVKDGSRSSTVRPAFLDLVGQQQGALAGAYSGYRNLMDGGAEGQAADLLNNLTKDQKVFALLYYHQEADAKKLHPLRNAYDIAQTISGLRKELILNRVKEGGKDDGELITLSPTQQKLLNDRLSDLQVRVQRNALVITKQPGFAGRKILPTYPLVEEIKAIDPRIAADLKKRMGSRIYPTDVVAKLWPQVEAEILKNQGKANLKTFVIKAKGSGNKIWSNGEAP